MFLEIATLWGHERGAFFAGRKYTMPPRGLGLHATNEDTRNLGLDTVKRVEVL